MPDFTTGITAERLRDRARMMEIAFVHINRDTTVEGLEHGLFLNGLAWKLKCGVLCWKN